MKYIWEPQDIHVGRQVDSHNRAERYMIGYDPSRDTEKGNLLLVSLRDGMVTDIGMTAADLAKRFNEDSMRAVCVREDDLAPAN